jgi:3-dehydroquinate synthase
MNTRICNIDLGSRSYDINIGSGLLSRISDFIPGNIQNRSIFIITDRNVKDYAAQVNQAFQAAGNDGGKIFVLPAGERTKSFEHYQAICEWLIEYGLNRKSLLVAVGGGVIGDLAGFAAATIMRGVEFVQVPTTLLSQVDSSVGGKTGINITQGKNLVGAFYQPSAVIADLDTLKTLPERELVAGYAEIVKYALINDAPFFNWLEENVESILQCNVETLSRAIETSVQAKAAIVQADETEQGRRALLNLGHTFGHALEAAALYDGRLLHGEAVAIGTMMAFDLSVRLGLCDENDKTRTESHFAKAGLPTHAAQIPSFTVTADKILSLMKKDKKATAESMNFIVVNAIGQVNIMSDIDEAAILQVINDSLLSSNAGIKDRWKSAFQ